MQKTEAQAPVLVKTSLQPPRLSSFWVDAWRRFRRSRQAMLGMIMVAILVAVAILAPVLAPYDMIKVNLKLQFDPPSLQHPFGTDFYGRDVLSRVLHGMRISLVIGLVPSFIAVAIGAVLGVLAGYYGRLVDRTIMRLADIILAFPSILLAMVFTYTLGASLYTLFIALSIVGWATVARVVRAQTLSLKQREFVAAARITGSRGRRIMFRHIIPNCLAPVIVLLTLNMPGAILSEAGLSFLGVGAQPPTPSLGLMVSEGQQYLFKAPWASIMPGFAILFVVLAFNFAGDGLRDAMDPYLQGDKA
jgi:peptide/nickel transport system permease protein/oligopeptide transport system permease protein